MQTKNRRLNIILQTANEPTVKLRAGCILQSSISLDLRVFCSVFSGGTDFARRQKGPALTFRVYKSRWAIYLFWRTRHANTNSTHRRETPWCLLPFRLRRNRACKWRWAWNSWSRRAASRDHPPGRSARAACSPRICNHRNDTLSAMLQLPSNFLLIFPIIYTHYKSII